MNTLLKCALLAESAVILLFFLFRATGYASWSYLLLIIGITVASVLALTALFRPPRPGTQGPAGQSPDGKDPNEDPQLPKG